MKNKTFFAIILCMATACMPSFAETTITVDSVRQRWPWNNKVDVTYTIAGDDATSNKVCKVMLTTVINGNAYAVYNPGLNVNVKPGTYKITWDDAPAGVICDTCTIKAEFYTSTAVPAGNDYMIVDLSDGAISYEGVFPASASLCGISGQNLSNARYNVDKYKKSHLVLRKVPAGTYLTGDGGTTEWTTDRDFYIGVFQWTSYQYWYLFEGNAAATEAHGAVQVALVARALKFDGDIRGSSDSTITPAGTTAANFKKVVPWLNGKTGLSFDLPTEVMHEIATRAGTTTTYSGARTRTLPRSTPCTVKREIVREPAGKSSVRRSRMPGDCTTWWDLTGSGASMLKMALMTIQTMPMRSQSKRVAVPIVLSVAVMPSAVPPKSIRRV